MSAYTQSLVRLPRRVNALQSVGHSLRRSSARGTKSSWSRWLTDETHDGQAVHRVCTTPPYVVCRHVSLLCRGRRRGLHPTSLCIGFRRSWPWREIQQWTLGQGRERLDRCCKRWVYWMFILNFKQWCINEFLYSLPHWCKTNCMQILVVSNGKTSRKQCADDCILWNSSLLDSSNMLTTLNTRNKSKNDLKMYQFFQLTFDKESSQAKERVWGKTYTNLHCPSMCCFLCYA